MTGDSAAERGAAAIGRLQEYMARSRRWRAEHPDQAMQPPGGVRDAADRRAEEDKLDRLDEAMRAYGAPAPKLTVPLDSTTGHAVEGELREQLLDWLPLVTAHWAPDGELAALDDVTSNRPQRLRAVLADEGFDYIHDAQLDDRHRVQLWVHRTDGLLAQVNDTRFDGRWTTENARVHGCVEVLDRELLLAGTVGTNDVHIPGEDATTRFAAISLALHLARPRRSLRVSLAAVRAAARPALPWPAPAVDGWIGPDSLNPAAGLADLEDTRPASVVASGTALLGLPADVHDAFGPNLVM
ncbi:hypothetical protein [Amycolatopsis sp. NPDC054798]